MSTAVARVEVACPNCHLQFADWWRPTLDPSVAVSPELLDESLPTECPHCHHALDWDAMDEHDDILSRWMGDIAEFEQ